MAKIFTNGTFDVFHPGHYQLLSYCRYLAEKDGEVIVAIDSDQKARRDKGQHRPYYGQEDRRNLLMMLTADGRLDSHGFGSFLADWVEVFDTDEQLHDLVKKYEPDYIVKGVDWRGKKVVGSDIAPVHFAPTFFKNYFSTTEIVKRILAKHPPEVNVPLHDPNDRSQW